jgi:Domain of unknown function (DUF4304)
MEKKDFFKIFDDLLKPLGFKKNASSWYIKSNELTKVIHLQRSYYSKNYYLHYGYILNSLPLNGRLMHISDGLTDSDTEKRLEMYKYLNLELDISDTKRYDELSKIISESVLYHLEKVNTQDDLLNYLSGRSLLNDIDLFVRDYLKI